MQNFFSFVDDPLYKALLRRRLWNVQRVPPLDPATKKWLTELYEFERFLEEK